MGQLPPLVADCVQAANATVGEGPVWDAERGALWWVDIRQGRILLYDPVAGQIGQWWMPSQVFSLSLTETGHLLVALETGLFLFQCETGELARLGTLVHGPGTTRFNDGKVDPAGRLWIGTVDLEEFKPTGVLYVVGPDGSFRSRLEGMRCSNGLGWTADGRTMFYTDSRRKVIWSFEFDAATSSLGAQTVFATIEGEGASPDGLAVDTDGCVWSALFGGSAILRFDPDGREMGRVPVPATRPTSCAFGGPDMRTLFVTSESFQLPIGALRIAPNGGGLFAIETRSVGVGVRRFARP